MVTIKNYKTITKSNGEKFYALVVQGGVEPVKSEETGRMYFTARTATVPTTLDEATCKELLGSNYRGTVSRVTCEPYEYIVESSGEILELSHRWEYIDEDQKALNDHVIRKKVKIK